jgi:hypothetical protein
LDRLSITLLIHICENLSGATLNVLSIEKLDPIKRVLENPLSPCFHLPQIISFVLLLSAPSLRKNFLLSRF